MFPVSGVLQAMLRGKFDGQEVTGELKHISNYY